MRQRVNNLISIEFSDKSREVPNFKLEDNKQNFVAVKPLQALPEPLNILDSLKRNLSLLESVCIELKYLNSEIHYSVYKKI